MNISQWMVGMSASERVDPVTYATHLFPDWVSLSSLPATSAYIYL